MRARVWTGRGLRVFRATRGVRARMWRGAQLTTLAQLTHVNSGGSLQRVVKYDVTDGVTFEEFATVFRIMTRMHVSAEVRDLFGHLLYILHDNPSHKDRASIHF